MKFARNDTQRMIADTVQRLMLEQNAFDARRKRLVGSAPDRMALWPQFAEIGITGSLFDEAIGGFGGTARDMAVVLYEIGQALAVEPYLAGVATSRILTKLEEGLAQPEIDALIGGTRLLVLAHSETADAFAPPHVTARPDGAGFRLDGVKPVVRYADVADAFIVTACLPNEAHPSCFLVEKHAEGCSVENFRLIDAAGAGTLRLNGAPATLLLTGKPAELAIIDALEWTIMGQASEAAGMLDALNTATGQYLQTRVQFGVPIGKFQALQHRAADMYIAAQEAAISVDVLLDAMDDTPSTSRSARISALKFTVDRAGRRVSHEAAQLHGGMGVTDELNISHYLRRFTAMRAEIGGADFHLARYRDLAA